MFKNSNKIWESIRKYIEHSKRGYKRLNVKRDRKIAQYFENQKISILYPLAYNLSVTYILS